MANLEKRNVVSVDNAGQVHPGTPETGNSWPEYFRPLPKQEKRQIVSVDNDGQVSQDEPETEGSKYFRPLPKTKRNMMKYAKLPLSEKRSEDCVINPSAAEWELEKCCKIWFPAPTERSAHNLLFRACSSGNHL